uniref:Histone domain-containing protein n=1 Tax=Panagrellus redivivus TaxID=6233 RepID=A0A7E4V0T4_PANRE
MRTKQIGILNYAVKSCTPRPHERSMSIAPKKKVLEKRNRRKTMTPKRNTTPPVVGLRDLRKFAGHVNQIPKKTFWRVVKGIMANIGAGDFKISVSAISALHEVTEEHMINFFERLAMYANHAKRVTIKPVDIDLARRIERTYQ